MLAAFPALGDQFSIPGGGNEEMANIKRQKRCEVTVIYKILPASSLLKSPDKPVDTCFMVPRAAEVLFTERNIFQPLSFIRLSWSTLPMTVGLQIQCKKKSILCDPLTLIHQNDR